MRHTKRRWLSFIWIGLLVISVALAGCSDLLSPQASPSIDTSTADADLFSDEFQTLEQAGNDLREFREVALFLMEHQRLPDHYLTKSEARKRGWIAQKGNLHDVAPGASIGGDVFQNREGRLPKAERRIWYEADIHYDGGTRGADRILYSNDGLIYMTRDHYKTFTRVDRDGGGGIS
ncbi:hypothetical protein A7K91_11595 [Paenibacillus oryzae]|uniref:Ribonuclease n=1 Tax=Paenibacillus oryzae TaxID=1844972 RepID=A0A1A5YFJ7_9BACL|nr:ribonuclease domain-containing protein [Paenibacillus oryzae]OBR64170.1 hypothetical protein A7K91_11595 [Paenibacillus oryzae]